MENSDDPSLRAELGAVHARLQAAVAPAVCAAKSVALNPGDHAAANMWRENNNEVINMSFTL